ncbi:hypothetical protein, partial [Geoglobus sp.]
YVNYLGQTRTAPIAKAFNTTPIPDYVAHKSFVEWANQSGMAVGENEACLACHTNFSLTINFVRPLYFEFTIDDQTWDITSISYGPSNTTTIVKSGDGAKHTWKALGDISCLDCHADIWNAINHSEPNPYNLTPNSSHLIWYWGGNNLGRIHDITEINKSYTNVTDYCLSSCHKPVITGGTRPPELDGITHAARRLSCYSCHTNSYTLTVLDKTGGNGDPKWPNSDTGDMDNFDVKVFSAPLFIHAETCIACKRAGVGNTPYTYRTYTEPSNVMYHYKNGQWSRI